MSKQSGVIQSPKHPFKGKKVYYSGSINGVAEIDLEFPQQLITYMKLYGANILDEHVAIPHKREQFFAMMAASHGISIEEWNKLEIHEQHLRIYEHDIRLVNEASHVVALLNGISTGVGMELQEALRKPKMGLNLTPILGLIHKNSQNKVSGMVKGAAQKYPHFQLQTYTNLAGAQKAIQKFLTNDFINLDS